VFIGSQCPLSHTDEIRSIIHSVVCRSGPPLSRVDLIGNSTRSTPLPINLPTCRLQMADGSDSLLWDAQIEYHYDREEISAAQAGPA
jgi:hypothetical protein